MDSDKNYGEALNTPLGREIVLISKLNLFEQRLDQFTDSLQDIKDELYGDVREGLIADTVKLETKLNGLIRQLNRIYLWLGSLSIALIVEMVSKIML